MRLVPLTTARPARSREQTPRRPGVLPTLVATTALSAGLLGLAPVAHAQHEDLPPGRRIVHYTVQPGDTATELAVRFHAWTAEIIAHNHLGPRATLIAGETIEIPVVVGAARRDPDRPLAGRDAGDRPRPRQPRRVRDHRSTDRQHEDLPPGRRIVHYTVQPGDTATELAVRFHAWTAEIIAHNHLGPRATLIAGETIEIPVVVGAARRDGSRGDRRDGRDGSDDQREPRRHDRTSGQGLRPPPGLVGERARVYRTIVRTARAHGVDPQLALAISWQEAGWRMHHVSSAGAIGAMQVLPSTGTWMSLYAGEPLQLHRREDNILAGILLLDLLTDETGSLRRATAAYFQGLAALREDGMYAGTGRYVADVMAIKRRIERGGGPSLTGP